MAAGDIFKKLLEQRRVQVTDPDPSDPEGNRRVVNATETTAAQEKASLMQERFGEWVWEDPARAAGLVDEYNRRFNSIVLRDYTVEGERLSFPGLVKDFTPRPAVPAYVHNLGDWMRKDKLLHSFSPTVDPTPDSTASTVFCALSMISSTGDFSAAAVARSMNSEIVMRIFAPESFSWKAISSGV
mgnify:CR=1 FL=1